MAASMESVEEECTTSSWTATLDEEARCQDSQSARPISKMSTNPFSPHYEEVVREGGPEYQEPSVPAEKGQQPSSNTFMTKMGALCSCKAARNCLPSKAGPAAAAVDEAHIADVEPPLYAVDVDLFASQDEDGDGALPCANGADWAIEHAGSSAMRDDSREQGARPVGFDTASQQNGNGPSWLDSQDADWLQAKIRRYNLICVAKGENDFQGRITRGQWNAFFTENYLMLPLFPLYDMYDSGCIQRREFLHAEMARDIFNCIDQNGYGIISREDWALWCGVDTKIERLEEFQACDLNGDGKVSLVDWLSEHKAAFRRNNATALAKFRRANTEELVRILALNSAVNQERSAAVSASWGSMMDAIHGTQAAMMDDMQPATRLPELEFRDAMQQHKDRLARASPVPRPRPAGTLASADL